MHNPPLIETANSNFFKTLLSFKKINVTPVGRLYKIDGFTSYNHLININSIFSTNPMGFPIDRTGQINLPLKWANHRPWQIPNSQLTLDAAMQQRVQYLSSQHGPINIFWSGGIDSTAIVTAFLKHCPDLSKIRILYSPWSHYEHSEYIDFLKSFPEVTLIDLSGELYLDFELDGIFISGNSGDEIHASIDQSFIEAYGYATLHESWQDFFIKKNNQDKFIDFCQWYFSLSGFEIKTVLEARWWFYTSNKISSLLRQSTIPFVLSGVNTNNYSPSKVYGFFDCYEYESFIYWNISDIMKSSDYKTWKQILKDYCFEFDHLEKWHENKSKFHSVQFSHYTAKKIILNDSRYILILTDGEKIQTPNLPFLSKIEFDKEYGSTLDYLFNDPDKL